MVLILLWALSLHAQHERAGAQDLYKNFQELAQHHQEGKDYAIVTKETSSRKMVMAFHGGFIEPGTTELATLVAKNDFDFYSFMDLSPDKMDEKTFTSSKLHLTSAHFDEPVLLKMVQEEDECMALHGFGGEETDFCVGGADAVKRKKTVSVLKEKFPELRTCELCCPPFNGTAHKNPVNQCKSGVQIEMSPRVRHHILDDQKFAFSLSESLRRCFNSPDGME